MEINDKPVQRKPLAGDDPVIDFTRPMRDGIAKFRETFEPKPIEPTVARESDRIELSAEARKLAADGDGATDETRRRERVAELRARYAEGRLNTPERIERAAERMLGAE